MRRSSSLSCSSHTIAYILEIIQAYVWSLMLLFYAWFSPRVLFSAKLGPWPHFSVRLIPLPWYMVSVLCQTFSWPQQSLWPLVCVCLALYRACSIVLNYTRLVPYPLFSVCSGILILSSVLICPVMMIVRMTDSFTTFF